MDLQILARIAALQVEAFAVNAEIEGMKAENALRQLCQDSPAYGPHMFNEAAGTLQSLANELKTIGGIR